MNRASNAALSYRSTPSCLASSAAMLSELSPLRHPPPPPPCAEAVLEGVVVEVGDPAELVLDAVDSQLDRGVMRLAVVGEGLQRIDIET